MSVISLSADYSRLQTLRSLAELDTSVDPTLNDLVRVAAHALGCPVAAICLSDEDRHWLKASHGLQLHPSLHEPLFHLYTIRERDMVVVTDARLDPRFADSPVVAREYGLRFYAGAPLRVDGHVVGTLCLTAPEPKALSSNERVLLLDLAHAVEHWFVSRREQVRLEAREREFRELADQMPGIVYRAALDEGSSKLYVSARVHELGYRPEDWVTRPDTWLEALHPGDRERVLRGLAQGVQEGRPFELRYRLRCRNGEWRHIRDAIRVIRPADGEEPIIQGVMLDDTERAVALAERELLLNDLPDGVLLLDTRQRISHANPQAQQVLGKTAAELKGRHIGHLFSGGEHDGQAELASRLQSADGEAIEWEYWHPDGSLRSLEDRRRVIDGGAEVRVLRDVTHRRNETAWLRMLAQAADQASEAIVITDLAANIVYVNQATTKTSGYSRAELMGRNSRMLQSGVTPSARYRKLWASLTAGKPWRGFLNNSRKDGSHYVEFAVITPVKDGNGRITNYLAIKEDITGKRRMGEDLARYREHLDELVNQRTDELELAKRSAERASAAKSAFLASVSHEIRTPMNGVIGIADVLRQSGLNAHQSDLVDTIRESAQVLLALINDILDFSKIEAGRLELDIAPFEPLSLLEHASDALQPVAAERAVRLECFVDPSLPARWMGDAARVRQIVMNLVGNALKFSSGLDRPGRVNLRVQSFAAGGLRLIVQDNGIGMSDELQQRLFQPFEQGDASTSTQYGGTGLGLAITQRLVGAMGGCIGIESVVGSGAKFTVDLPLQALGDGHEATAWSLQGVHCFLQGGPDEPVQDWLAYLRAAGATAVVCDTAVPPTQGDRLTVILSFGVQVSGGAVASPWVRLQHEDRDLPQMSHDGAVLLRTKGMHKDDLLQAVAIAAGRAQPATRAPTPPEHPSDELLLAACGRLVLVAEDNEINQTVILQQLQLLGLSAELVDDGLAALELWRRAPERFALLLTDLRMPGMDGIALVRAIREAEQGQPGRHVPVLALTANILDGEAERCREAGMDGYLSKPVPLELLRTTLLACLRQGRADRPAPVQPVTADMVLQSQDMTAWQSFDDDLPVRLVGDDPELLEELRQRFLRASSRALIDILRAVGRQEWREVGMVAHRVKSSAHATGAVGLYRLLDRMEHSARLQKIDELRAAVDALTPAVGAVIERFRRVKPLASIPERLGLLCVNSDPDQRADVLHLADVLGLPDLRVFDNGESVLDALQNEDGRGWLLLVDLLMPGMDAVELIGNLGALGFAGGVALFSGADPLVLDTAERLLLGHGIRSLGRLGKPIASTQLAGVWQTWQAMNAPPATGSSTASSP